MAIFGAGSKWENEELKDDFFENNNYVIGWDIEDANDLYNMISSIKAGDIIYLKANSPGSFDIRVKGIGIVKKSLLTLLFDENKDLADTRSGFKLPVEWICKEEFIVSIPNNIGKLTNVRAATLYEEFLPFVQDRIIGKILAALK